MVLPIVLYGSPVLRKKATQIDEKDENLQKLIKDMYDTMYKSDGLGLAAPQVGQSVRLFVIDTSPLKEEHPELDGFKRTFINPEIISEEGEMKLYSEGCLSLPTIREDVSRKAIVTIFYRNENWEEITETFDGVKARVVQHEYDHLEGIMFVDRLNPIKKRLLHSKLNSISKGKIKADYKTKVAM